MNKLTQEQMDRINENCKALDDIIAWRESQLKARVRRFELTLAGLVLMVIGALVMLFSGCATTSASVPGATVSIGMPTAASVKPVANVGPFVTSYPADLSLDPRNPYESMIYSRPRPATVAVTLHNPGTHDVVVEVFCYGNVFEGKSTRQVRVRAGAERRFLAEVQSWHMYNPCAVQSFHYLGLPGPAADL